MSKRILAITFIYVCSSIAWIILAGAMKFRTDRQDTKLRKAVAQLWGSEQTQSAPSVYCKSSGTNGKKGKGGVQNLPLEASDIKVDLKLEHRKKGLLWYSAYRVAFSGKYQVINNSDNPREIFLNFKFPTKGAIYDKFRFTVGGEEIQDIELQSGNITEGMQVSPGQTEEVEISYESQGLDVWLYDFGEDVNPVRNFSLVLQTDFDEIDFPQGSISPTHKEVSNNGWKLTWEYSNLLTGAKIGMITPQKLNPGPWTSRVTATAPVSLFLFFFLMFVFTTVKKIKIHPMNYFFVAAAFFSFHLLLSYLVDHISIHGAFWICSAVSIFLVVSYMRLVVGGRFAFIEIAFSQLVYLVLFSYTFFFKGYTGLTITGMCICTLFVVMQFTGKVDWEQVFAKSDKPTDSKALA
ncbi:MAG: inner membrane CreD family protein [Planctomycetota bacterium]|jgi:inner membrane protein involved in colicin E2 resistance